MVQRTIPLAAMEKIIKKINPEIRVSDKAKAALKAVIEERAEQIAERAWRFAEHAKRRTVKEEDVKLAARHFKA